MRLSVVVLILWGLSFPFVSAKGEEGEASLLEQKVRLKKKKGTVYDFLKEISLETGYLFVFDSEAIRQDAKVELKKKEGRLGALIAAIIPVPVTIEPKGKYLILKVADDELMVSALPIRDQYYLIRGKLIDQYTQEPIPYVSVSVDSASLGTITNESGEFRLALPAEYSEAKVLFSSLGYQSKTTEASILKDMTSLVPLTPTVIPIQEVTIRYMNPLKVLENYRENKEKNYAHEPVNLTSFYREGRKKKKQFVDLSEAVFKVYKTGLNQYSADQVMLHKMQRYSNIQEADSLLTKLKAGIEACLQLDVVKHEPDFLQPAALEYYEFTFNDIMVIDDREVCVIGFKQKESIIYPLFCGQLYFDLENFALIQAVFEVAPQYVKKATPDFVLQAPRQLRVGMKKVRYMVSYRRWDDLYYMNHVRGEMVLQMKKKKSLFKSVSADLFFEMLAGRIQTEDVKPIQKSDRLKTQAIFSETNFLYDYDFWGAFNVIEPEEDLQESLERLSLKIEQIEE